MLPVILPSVDGSSAGTKKQNPRPEPWVAYTEIATLVFVIAFDLCQKPVVGLLAPEWFFQIAVRLFRK